MNILWPVLNPRNHQQRTPLFFSQNIKTYYLKKKKISRKIIFSKNKFLLNCTLIASNSQNLNSGIKYLISNDN